MQRVQQVMLDKTAHDGGADGDTGSTGTAGQNGADGADGADGTNGIDGQDGATGQAGADGEDGTDGTDGVDGAGETSLFVMDNADVGYTNDYTLVLSPDHGNEESADDIYVFQYREDFTQTDDEITISINGSSPKNIRIIADGGGLRNLTLNDIIRYNYYIVYRAGNFWHLVGGTLHDHHDISDWAEVGNTDLIPDDKLPVGLGGTDGTDGQTALTGDTDLVAMTVSDGTDGDDGDTPRFSVHNDGSRRVLQLEGYVDSGGTFTAQGTATYVGSNGFVTNVSNAVNIRGSTGSTGNRLALQVQMAMTVRQVTRVLRGKMGTMDLPPDFLFIIMVRGVYCS